MTPLARMHLRSLLLVWESKACFTNSLTGCIQGVLGQWEQTHKQIISYKHYKMPASEWVIWRTLFCTVQLSFSQRSASRWKARHITFTSCKYLKWTGSKQVRICTLDQMNFVERKVTILAMCHHLVLVPFSVNYSAEYTFLRFQIWVLDLKYRVKIIN